MASGSLRGYHCFIIREHLRNTQLAYQLLETLASLWLQLLLRRSKHLLEDGNKTLSQSLDGRVLELVCENISN